MSNDQGEDLRASFLIRGNREPSFRRRIRLRQRRPRSRRRRLLRHRWLFRRKWFHESFFEIVNVFEVFNRIFFGFSKNARADQVEHHVADIFRAMNSPVLKDGDNHGTEFFERVLPHSIEQFRASDMPNRRALHLLLLLGGKIERVAQKNVAVPVITRITGDDRVESFGKSNLLHNLRGRNDKRQDTCRQLLERFTSGLLVRPNRKFAAAGLDKMKTATARKVKNLLRDFAAKTENCFSSFLQSLGIKYDQRRAGIDVRYFC